MTPTTHLSTQERSLVLIIGLGTLTALGLLTMTLRFLLGLLLSLLGIHVPLYAYLTLFLSPIFTVVAFPSATGQLVTMVLAKRAGFVSAKIGRVDVWNVRVEDVTVESPLLGFIHLRSLGVKWDWRRRWVKLQVSGVRVDVKRRREEGKKKGKRSEGVMDGRWALLRFVRFVQVNIDFVEVSYRGVTARTRDFTFAFRLGSLEEHGGGKKHLHAMHAVTPMVQLQRKLCVTSSLGMFSIAVCGVDDCDPALHLGDTRAAGISSARLTSETDELFPVASPAVVGANARSNSATTVSASKKAVQREFLKTKADLSFKLIGKQMPPMFEMERATITFHVSASDMDTMFEETIIPQRGSSVSIGAIRSSLSSSTLMHVTKILTPSLTSSPPTLPSNNNPRNRPPSLSVAIDDDEDATSPTEKPNFKKLKSIAEMLAVLGKIRADPFVFSAGLFACDWYDVHGPCTSLSLAINVEATADTARATVKAPTVTTATGSNSGTSGEKPFFSIDSISWELVPNNGAKTSCAVLVNDVHLELRPSDFVGFERSHMEFLRFVRSRPKPNPPSAQAVLLKRPIFANAAASSGSATSGTTAAAPVPLVTDIEFALTNGIRVDLLSLDPSEAKLSFKIETLFGNACMLPENRKTSLNTSGISFQVGSDTVVQAEQCRGSSADVYVSSVLDPIKKLTAEVEDLFIVAATASAIRGYRTWKQFAHRLAHWREATQALRSVIQAERALDSPIPKTPLGNNYQSMAATKKKIRQSAALTMKRCKFELMLGIGQGVALHLPMVNAQSEDLSTSINGLGCDAVDVSVVGFHFLSGSVNRRILKISSITFEEHVLTLTKIRAWISAYEEPYIGDFLTAYFQQRKALTIALKDIDDSDIALSNTVIVASSNANSSLSGDVSQQEELPIGGEAGSDARRSSLIDPDIERFNIRILVVDVCVELEDDDGEDDPKYACSGFFNHERRLPRPASLTAADTSKVIARFNLQRVEADASILTAWKSRVGHSTDAALLRKTPPKNLRTRAYLLKIIARCDAPSCPSARFQNALVHGLADLMAVEFKSCILNGISLKLSDYPLPWISLATLTLASKSSRPARIVAADLRAVHCSTKDLQIKLCEVWHSVSPLNRVPITIASKSSLIPVKIYFDIPQASAQTFTATSGDSMNPALVALDRALVRALPGTSDNLSPKLGWWDKVRYLMHGQLSLHCTDGFEIRLLTKSPHQPENYVALQSSEFLLTDYIEEETPPEMGVDMRAWEASFSDFYLKMAHTDHEDGRVARILAIPKFRLLVSLAWRCQYGGDHYVQLHHINTDKPDDVPDQYAFFRSQSLDLGLDFEVKRALGKDFSVKDKCPTWEICWRPVYPLIMTSYRGIVPPVPPAPHTLASPSLGRCMTRVAFNVRADRPHIVWWEDRHATLGFMLRGRTVDSRTVFTKSIQVGAKWEQESVLSQYAAVEAYVFQRAVVSSSLGAGKLSTWWGEEFGFGEHSYAYGIGMPYEPFFVCSAMRLTLGSWKTLQLDVMSSSEGDDAKSSYYLILDGVCLLWTLQVRDETFRYLSTTAYIMRKESRLHDLVTRKFVAADAKEVQRTDRMRRMDLSWLWNRERSPLNSNSGVPSPASSTRHNGSTEKFFREDVNATRTAAMDKLTNLVYERFPGINPRMASFLSSRSSQTHPIVVEETSTTESSSVRDRHPPCSTSSVSADGLKATWEEACRDFTLELRWLQVSLQTDRSIVVLSSKSATVRDFRLALLDLGSQDDDSSLWRKEIDVDCRDSRMFAVVLSESSAPGTRWVKSERPSDVALCLSETEFEFDFVSARGCVRRTGLTQQTFTDRVSKLLNSVLGTAAAPVGGSTLGAAATGLSFYENEEACLRVINERRARRGPFYDISHKNQDPQFAHVAHTDGFQVTDVVYTDATGGARVPSAHLGMRVLKADAQVSSRDFFCVLNIVRDLLLVGPPPDVKELAVLAEHEAKEELKRRWNTAHFDKEPGVDGLATLSSGSPPSSQPSTMASMNGEASATGPSGIDDKRLKAYVERICASRPKMLIGGSQRIVYEVEECRLTLTEPNGKEKVQAIISGFRGDHMFALNGSTAVEFEVGNLTMHDLVTRQQIVECQVLDNASSIYKTPFLRADAVTSAPIIAFGYRVTVYEMLQIHLFPGSRYRFRTKLHEKVATFIRKFLAQEEETDSKAIKDLPVVVEPETAAGGGGTVHVDGHHAAVVAELSSSLSNRHAGGYHLTDTGLMDDKASVAGSTSTSITTATGSVAPSISSTARGGENHRMASSTNVSVGQVPLNSTSSTMRRFTSKVIKSMFVSSTGGGGESRPAANVGGDSMDDRSFRASDIDAMSNFNSDRGLVPITREGSSGAANEKQKSAPEAEFATGIDNEDDDEFGGGASDTEDPTHNFALQSGALAASASPGKSTTLLQSHASSKSITIIRGGMVNRISVPKLLQQHPEPTIQPWATTIKRKSHIVLLVKHDEAMFEIHRSELGMRLKVTPRAVVRLADVFKIQRSKDPSAPPHAIDIFYRITSNSTGGIVGVPEALVSKYTILGGEGVFTWAADEPGWPGKDAALPWVAAFAPGLGKGVLDRDLEKEISSHALESILKRSAGVMHLMGSFGGSFHGDFVGRRPTTLGRNVGGIVDEDTDEESTNSSGAGVGFGGVNFDGVSTGAKADVLTTPTHVESSVELGIAALGGEDFTAHSSFLQQVAMEPSAAHAATGVTLHALASNQIVVVAAPTSEKPLVDIAFFKYARIGQIQLDLTLQGYTITGVKINNVQRNAFCPPAVYHRQLWTWNKAFRTLQRYATQKLLSSALRGGAGTHLEDFRVDDPTVHMLEQTGGAVSTVVSSAPSVTTGWFKKRNSSSGLLLSTKPTPLTIVPVLLDEDDALNDHHGGIASSRSGSYVLGDMISPRNLDDNSPRHGGLDESAKDSSKDTGGGEFVASDAAKYDLLFGKSLK